MFDHTKPPQYIQLAFSDTYAPKLCRTCGLEFPRTLEFFYSDKSKNDNLSTQCKSCKNNTNARSQKVNPESRKRANKKWRQNNPEKNREYSRNYYHSHAEQEQARSREWKVNNHGKVIVQQREWLKANPDKVREYKRIYRLTHPDKERTRILKWKRNNREHILIRERARRKRNYHNNPERERERSRLWQKANPEIVRANHRRRRARLKNAEGSHTTDEIQALYKQQEGKCFHCGVNFKSVFTEDHVIPLSRGGSDYIENIVLMCRSCNSSKGAKLLHEWCPKKYSPPQK